MFITPSFKKSLIVEQFQGNYLKDASFKRFENSTVELLDKETKCTLLEVRTFPIFLETLISKYEFGPVKLPGLSRNRNGILFYLCLLAFRLLDRRR